MSTVNYTIKPFHPASAAQPGQQPASNAGNLAESGRPTPQRQLASPDVTLVPEAPSRMKKLALDKGAEWCRILREALTPDEAGKTLLQKFTAAEAATIIGTSAPTLCRLLKKFGKLSIEELIPERLAPALDGGNESDWEFLLKQPAVRAKLLELYNATIGAANASAANDRRTAKLATALKQFVYEPECPKELGSRLSLGYQPAPFIRYLRSAVTPEGEARLRGPKHYALYGPSSRRDWSARLPNGDRFEIPAAYTLSMDDMSENHPFYVELPAEAGTILSRQGLYALWAKHKVWQSVELVARRKESYTAADILRAFYKMCLALGGVPPFVEFEQGIWKSRKISGFSFDDGWLVEEVVDRPGMEESQMNNITDGLGLCGVKVLYKYKAHQKHIESNFNPLQTVMAIVARQFQHIGRYAGEYEHGSKQIRRVRAASHHPRDLGFASQAELADCLAEAFRRINDQPSTIEGKTRAEAHWDDLGKVGLLPLTGRLFAACLPGEMRKTTLRDGAIHIQNNNWGAGSACYRHEKFAHLGDGYELFYKIDETDPNLGCAVFNRTAQTNSANFQNWKPGEFMFTAAREIPGPKLEVATAPAGVRIETVEERYGAGAVDAGDTVRRKQDKFNATQFRSMPRPGQIPVKSASARDGAGRVVEISNQNSAISNAPASALPPRPQHNQAEIRRRQIAANEALVNLSD